MVHRFPDRIRPYYRLYRRPFQDGRDRTVMAVGRAGRTRSAWTDGWRERVMMKRLQIGPFLGSVLVAALLTGCNARLPGQPTEAERWRAPADVSDFGQLYTQNCAGCHGANGI